LIKVVSHNDKAKKNWSDMKKTEAEADVESKPGFLTKLHVHLSQEIFNERHVTRETRHGEQKVLR
jgi:hypothetical protein